MKLTFCLFFALLIVIIIIITFILIRKKAERFLAKYGDIDDDELDDLEDNPRSLLSYLFYDARERFNYRRKNKKTKGSKKKKENDKLENYLKDRLKEIKNELKKTDGYINALSGINHSSKEVLSRVESANEKYELLKAEESKIKKLLK